jgi:hypothetical protein
MKWQKLLADHGFFRTISPSTSDLLPKRLESLIALEARLWARRTILI